MKSYPQTSKGGTVRRLHVVIAEKVLGKPLPKGAIVHHLDGGRLNNAHSNLLICPSQAYHLLIHARERAYDACGNANWRKCAYCHAYDDPARMYIRKDKPTKNAWHMACKQRRENELRALKRAAL